MLKDNKKVRGTVKITLRGPDGKIKEEETVKNLIVDAGLDWIAGRIQADADIPDPMSHMAIGDGSTAAADGDTTLNNELGRVALDSITRADNVTTYTATFGAGVGTGSIEEAGIFNADPDGAMLCRTTFAVKNKASDDSMTIVWNITQSAA